MAWCDMDVQLVESELDSVTINKKKLPASDAFYKFLIKTDAIVDDPMIKIRVLKAKKPTPFCARE